MMFLHSHNVYLLLGIPLLLATAPLLVEVLVVTAAAMMPRRSRTGQAAESGRSALGRLIVLVPSHNEELSIGRCVENLARSAGGTGDILVVAHNCGDATADRARAAGAMVSVLDDPELSGKGSALAHGFRTAFAELGADAALVIDADSTVSPNLVACVRQRLEHAPVVQCRYQCRSEAGDPKSRLRALAFFCMNVIRPRGRQRLGLSCGIFGNGFALRREVIEQVQYAAHSIVEDLEFHLSLVDAGMSCEFVEEARVWAEVPASGRGAATQSARWEGGRLWLLRRQGPSLLGSVFQGRFALAEPLLDLASLPLALEVIGLIGLALFPVRALRVYAFSGMAVIALHLLYAICCGADPLGDIRALLQVPVYLVAKIGMLPRTLRMTRERAAWVRTPRGGAAK